MAINIVGGIDGVTVGSDPTALKLTGGTLSGKVNFSPVAGVAGINIGIGGNSVDSNTPGDIYINTGSATIGFRDSVGVSKLVACLQNGNAFTAIQSIDVSNNTTPALRVTQRGTGHAILVEDSTNPDSTPFVVTNAGQAVFGDLTPYSTAVLTVKGGASIESGSYYVRVDSGGVGMYGQLVLMNQTTVTGTANFNDYNNDLAVTVNGQTIFIPYRV